MLFALAFGTALSALVIIGNKVWFSGHHIWDIPPDKYVGHRLNIWVCRVLRATPPKASPSFLARTYES
jgi:hypothetical protein